ncbi:hypothetical protein PanWU01x14_233350, partial [Parasponia andersonii]
LAKIDGDDGSNNFANKPFKIAVDDDVCFLPLTTTFDPPWYHFSSFPMEQKINTARPRVTDECSMPEKEKYGGEREGDNSVLVFFGLTYE